MPSDWDRWASLGLGEDLLPVVSAPGFPFHARSELKALGKVPSRFTPRDEVVGFPNWTGHHTSQSEIAAWRQDRRLGLCIQTRRVKAIDIDVNHADVVAAIQTELHQLTGKILPMRSRTNSSKALMLFWCDAYISKRRVLWVGDGRQPIELLGNGQHFVANGAHWSAVPNEPSGAHYAWDGGLPSSIPVLTKDEALAIWDMIVQRYGLPATAKGGADRERRTGEKIDTTDAVALFLEDNGLVLGQDGAKLFVDCPNKHLHSGDSGLSQTAWLMAGSSGYERGHFHCFHSSCGPPSDDEFLAAVGYLRFEPIVEQVDASASTVTAAQPPPADWSAPWPSLRRDARGRIEPVLPNVVDALSSASFSGFWLRHDRALGAVTVTNRAGQTREINDVDLINLRLAFERRGFGSIPREMMRDARDAVAALSEYDSLIEWATSLVTDGVPRIERFLIDYLGCADTPYHRAVGLYWWTAMAGRLLQPGIQADMVPVILGEQGIGKTQLLKAIVPQPRSYVELNLAWDDEKLARLMRGTVLGELAELRGLSGRDAESIKAWITRQVEKWVPKYQELATEYPRRCIFVGTTNKREFLDDPSGERRWLPFEASKADVINAARDRDQLWAEAIALFDMAGILWRDAQQLAPEVHREFKLHDPWEEMLLDWLANHPDVMELQPKIVAVTVLGQDWSRVSRADQMRIGKILRNCGFTQRVRSSDGANRTWVYRRMPHRAFPGPTENKEGEPD
jgi:hypothetical protein